MSAVYVNGKYVLQDSTFTVPKGKRFVGWSLSKDGEIIIDLNVDDNITVYAIWKYINEEKNPSIGDNYITYIIVSIISLTSLIVASIYTNKKLAY